MVIEGFAIGIAFGAALFLSGLANPDKIIGTMRFKDFHAMRVIAVFVLVGMAGVWVLDLMGLANFSIKPAAVVSILVGGGLLGAGFGATGFCPGTGLASAASGHFDALVSLVGMLFGALVFILISPAIGSSLDDAWQLGKVQWPDLIPVAGPVLAVLLIALGSFVLWKTAKPSAK